MAQTMFIKKVNIENFKCFKGKFSIEFNNGINILVGNNEAGKSTILEAVNLALTGVINGRYLRNELSQYLFNNDVVKEYFLNISNGKPVDLPHILIEVFFADDSWPLFKGNGNSEKRIECGVVFKIEFDSDYKSEYEALVSSTKEINSIPIEYYKITWKSCARESITARSIPMKSVLIDSSSNRYQNGSDIYISRIIKNDLEDRERVDLSQAHRKMKEAFMESEPIKAINAKVKDKSKISDKNLQISVDLSTHNSWETTLMVYLDETPFHQIGKGEQCIIKTNLALSHEKSQEASLILLEEPENHLSHTKLNQLIKSIEENCKDKQVIISTHSSFVANKLGLDHLILLNNNTQTKLTNLTSSTKEFFEKIAGYNTLRMILCKKAILVEGDSDELVVQKAYMSENNGKLPIENGIDVISVGISFLRFLEIAEKINMEVSVVTDNDGDIVALQEKYKNYIVDHKKDNIKICYDEDIDNGSHLYRGKPFNYNTLEPKLLKNNSLELFNKIFETKLKTINDMHTYMKNNKAECALKLFKTDESIIFPQYIMEAIEKNEN